MLVFLWAELTGNRAQYVFAWDWTSDTLASVVDVRQLEDSDSWTMAATLVVIE